MRPTTLPSRSTPTPPSTPHLFAPDHRLLTQETQPRTTDHSSHTSQRSHTRRRTYSLPNNTCALAKPRRGRRAIASPAKKPETPDCSLQVYERANVWTSETALEAELARSKNDTYSLANLDDGETKPSQKRLYQRSARAAGLLAQDLRSCHLVDQRGRTRGCLTRSKTKTHHHNDEQCNAQPSSIEDETTSRRSSDAKFDAQVFRLDQRVGDEATSARSRWTTTFEAPSVCARRDRSRWTLASSFRFFLLHTDLRPRRDELNPWARVPLK